MRIGAALSWRVQKIALDLSRFCCRLQVSSACQLRKPSHYELCDGFQGSRLFKQVAGAASGPKQPQRQRSQGGIFSGAIDGPQQRRSLLSLAAIGQIDQPGGQTSRP